MENESQVLYLGRWVSKEHFRAFVYNKEGQKLAKSYNEFAELIASGLWNANPLLPINNLSKEEFEQPIEEPESDNDTKIVDIKPKRDKKCHNQRKV